MSFTVRERKMDSMNPDRTPLVSVIMPAYNTAHLITASLNSVFAQDYQNLEIMVVNDGSPDTRELEAVLSRYQDRIVYIRQENKRAAGARNTAIQRAQGDLLAFLDSDDVWFADHLSSQLKLFAEYPQLDLVYSNCFVSTDSDTTFMELSPSTCEARFESLVEERCQIPISTVVARKQAVEKAGLFDESLARCDDYDMWLRVAFHGGKIGYTRKVQARLNQGRADSLGIAKVKMLEADWEILQKIDRDLPLSHIERRCVRQRLGEVRGHCLLEEGKVQLDEGNFRKAKDLFAEANVHLQRSRLSLIRFSLALAPNLTRKLINFVRWCRQQGRSPATAQG